jgi:hypothetical protein
MRHLQDVCLEGPEPPVLVGRSGQASGGRNSQAHCSWQGVRICSPGQRYQQQDDGVLMTVLSPFSLPSSLKWRSPPPPQVKANSQQLSLHKTIIL